MAQFKIGVDQTVTAKAPDARLDILVSTATPFSVGKHVFELVATDDSGNLSEPARVTIIIVDKDRPTAVIDVLDPNGARNPAPQVSVPFGQRFSLVGDRSTDIGGTVEQFTWTLLQP